MPIYDFKCRDCGKVSEIFLRNVHQKVCCPHCGSSSMEKLLSSSYMIRMEAPARGTLPAVAERSGVRHLRALQGIPADESEGAF